MPNSNDDPITPLDISEPPLRFGFVYRWVNLVNGKMYIGSHCGTNSNYRASGVAIVRAFRTHGMNNFRRELLYVGENYREEEEKFLILVDATRSPLYYNMMNTAIGQGKGADNPMYGKSGILSPVFGKKITEFQRKRLSETHKGKVESAETREKKRIASAGKNNPNYGKTMSDEQKKKISETRIALGVAVGEKNPNYGRPRSDSVKEKLRMANLGKVAGRVTCPHCQKTGGNGGMQTWHFDKCKYK